MDILNELINPNYNLRYDMSEQAFIDEWNKIGCPNELIEFDEINNFFQSLFKVTNGLFIFDHFFGGDYDNVKLIETKQDYFLFHWKNFDKSNLREDDKIAIMELFGGYTYIFTILKIKKIKFELINNHLFIVVMPIVSNLRKVENALNINSLNNSDKKIIENDQEFLTEIRYKQNKKITECFVYHLPFYSFLIQPKENGCDRRDSHYLLLKIGIEELIDRSKKNITQIEKLNKFQEFEIRMVASSSRILLENFFKYYYVLLYGKLHENYDRNYSEKVFKRLEKRHDEIINEFSSTDINFLNKASHDDGDLISLEKIKEIASKIDKIIRIGIKKIIENDELLLENYKKEILNEFNY